MPQTALKRPTFAHWSTALGETMCPSPRMAQTFEFLAKAPPNKTLTHQSQHSEHVQGTSQRALEETILDKSSKNNPAHHPQGLGDSIHSPRPNHLPRLCKTSLGVSFRVLHLEVATQGLPGRDGASKSSRGKEKQTDLATKATCDDLVQGSPGTR